MRKSRTPGSVRGVSGNGYPYRDTDCCENGHADTVLADLYVKQKLFLHLYCTGRFPG